MAWAKHQATVDPCDRRSVTCVEWLHNLYLPNLDKSIIRRADQHITGRSVGPTAAVDIVCVCVDLDGTLVSNEIVH